jgi:hypothetical protein
MNFIRRNLVFIIVVSMLGLTMTYHIAQGGEKKAFSPSVGDRFDLGQSDRMWKNLYLSGGSEQSYLDLATDIAETCVAGRIKWNEDDGTSETCTDIVGHVIQHGQEIAPRVVNKAGFKILNGQVVTITGAQGNRMAVGLANAASATTSRIIGVATSDIEDNATGPVTLIGKVRGVDTRNFSTGDLLFLSATVDGGMVNSVPDAPNRKAFIGVVESSTVSGEIWVTIANGRPIWGLHDVYNQVANAVADDSLLFDGTAWINIPHTYGELYYHSDIATLDFSTDVALINVTGLTNGVFSNVTLSDTDGSITIIDADTYLISLSASFRAASAGDFDLHVGIDGVDQDKCHANRRIGTGTDVGNIGITCMLELDAAEVVTFMVNSVASETIKFEALNWNMERIP